MVVASNFIVRKEQKLYRYVIRSLKEAEVDSWAEFCARVFSYKPHPPPASYFARHFHNDPDREIDWILVATVDEKIVASCRVFRRYLMDDSLVYGIGEVCTDPQHRRRGLSSRLLNDAHRDIIKEGVSVLHASASFFSFYERLGYQSVRTRWTQVHVEVPQLPAQESRQIRPANFALDTEGLMQVHSEYSRARFMGLRRTKDYWHEYLSAELENDLHVDEDSKGRICSYLALRHYPDRVILRDFGCSAQSQVAQRMAILLSFALQRADARGDSSIEFVVPTLIYEEIDGAPWLRDPVRSADDLGWMYRNDDNPHADVKPHLIWPVDSF